MAADGFVVLDQRPGSTLDVGRWTPRFSQGSNLQIVLGANPGLHRMDSIGVGVA